MVWLIGSYVLTICFFIIYSINMLDEVKFLESKIKYIQRENDRLQHKLDKIYSKIDKVRNS